MTTQPRAGTATSAINRRWQRHHTLSLHITATLRDPHWPIFAATMIVVIVGWVAPTPFTLRHPRVVQRVGFALVGPTQRLFEHLDATPGQFGEKDISPVLLAQRPVPRLPGVHGPFRRALRRLPAADQRPRRSAGRADDD
ncbi:MAG: hypothetical protein ACR2M5_05145, partial [Nakamurella sp.]